MKFTAIATAGIAAAALVFVQPTEGTIVLTQPVASTKVKGGGRLKVEWNDDGQTPKLSSDWGKVNVFLAAGSQFTQYKLQTLAQGLDNDVTDGSWRVDSNIGPDGSFYFIRMESTKLDAKGAPYMAFSARFTLTDMKGTFNATVMAAAQGKEGSAQGSTSTSTGTATGSGSTTSSSTTATGSMTTTKATATSALNATSSTTKKTSSAAPLRTDGMASAAILSCGLLAAGIALLL